MAEARVAPPLTFERARELLTLDADTGRLFWTDKAAYGRLNGQRAGSSNGRYRQIRVGRDVYLEHRIVWLLTTGAWPVQRLDHIDGDRSNNHPLNLRYATASENAQNLRPARRGTMSGLLGVSWQPGRPGRSRGRWEALIKIDGKTHRLGRFDCKFEAHEAYLRAKRELHPFGNL